MVIFVNTAMRVGSTWVTDLLSELVGQDKLFWADAHDIPVERFTDFCEEHKAGRVVVKVHFANSVAVCEAIPEGNFVVGVERDLADMVVSLAFYNRYDCVNGSDPDPDMADQDFIDAYLDSERLLDLMRRGANLRGSHARYFRFDYAALVADTGAELSRFAAFIAARVRPAKLRRTVSRWAFEACTGRAAGTENRRAFQRRGVVGDHANWLKPQQVARLHELASAVGA